MFSKLQFSFRTKIFIALGMVVFLSIATFLLVIQETTKSRVREDIRSRFQSTIYTFRQLQELRRQFVSDEISSLTLSNPQFRTILSTASVMAEDFGFSLPTDRGEIFRDANLRLNSLLPFLTVYHKSDIFLVTTAQGELLFSKSDPEKFGNDLSRLSAFQKIYDEGEAVDIWDSRLQTSGNVKIFPSGGQKAVYQIVAKPVAFGEEVHGAVIWGSRIDRETLEGIKEISSVDIVLYSGGRVSASTLPPQKEEELSNLIRLDSTDGEDTKGDSIREVSLGGERFMTQRSPVLPDARIKKSGFIVLRSLTQELGFLRKLQVTLLFIGVLILLLAIGLSFLVSGGVTKPVRTLASAARRIGEGNLEASVNISTGDELEELGGAFNEMVRGLKEREFIKTTFERYVSKAVASELIRNPEMVRLGGLKRELTVMFSDIGGFTTLSETLPPESIVRHLNEYFEGMSAAILEFDGTINQFQGDAIVAFWGAPVPQENHPVLACFAALRCREFLESLQAKWFTEGLPHRTFRFGINTGEMVVGNIGSSSRFEYTVIGDEVNLASRLEGVNKIYGTQILISDKTCKFVKEEVVVRELDVIRVVGKAEPVRIFELVSRKGELDDRKRTILERFQVGIDLYRERKWDEAEECFRIILELEPADKPSQEYMRRCKEYQNFPPPTDWESVFELRGK